MRSDLAAAVRSRGFSGGVVALCAILLFIGVFLGAFVQPAQAVTYGAEELAFAHLLNDYRVGNGLEPLLISDMLSEAAERHCSDMAKYDFFDHYTTGGSDWFSLGASPWDRMAASGYVFNTTKGENIAAGQATAAEVFSDWKASPGHNANMLSPDFKVVGISYVEAGDSSYGSYWTTDYGCYVDKTTHALDATADTTEPTPADPDPAEPAEPAPADPDASPTDPLDFSDVDGGTLYQADIERLAALGIVRGYEDGSFRPASPVTRQQFAKMIALTLGYDVHPVTATGFTDVQTRLDRGDALYPAGYIAACSAAGVITGKADGAFAPFDNVTRAQLITMIARATRLPECPSDLQTPFGDFSPDHYPWAARAWAAGLLDGLSDIDADYAFWADATRAEACALLCNLLDLRGSVSD